MLEHENTIEPESPIEPESTLKGRVWGFWPTVGFGLVIGVAFIITGALVVIGIVAALFVSSGTLVSDPSQYIEMFESVLGLSVSLSSLATGIVGVGLIVLFIKVRGNITIGEYLGLSPIRIKTILAVVAITAGFLLVSGALSTFLERPFPELMLDSYKTSVWPVLFWIAVVVFAPAFEEAFFRGFLFEGFRYSRIGVVGAIVLTSLAWTSLHIQYDTYEMATIFAMGLLMGFVRYKTGSLWSPLLMHGLNNLAATVELALYVNGAIT
jgi:membrane protease YdiL (CAAX protease family)